MMWLYTAAGPENNVLHPSKGITIWDFLTYQAFKRREGIISRKKIKDKSILNSQNEFQAISLTGVRGVCEFFFFFIFSL